MAGTTIRRSVVGFALAIAVPAGAAHAQPPTSSQTLVTTIQPGADDSTDSRAAAAAPGIARDATDWSQLIGNSLRLVSLEHLTRLMLQPDTRQALAGDFFGDYLNSIRRPHGWNDGNPWAVNYIGHPIHGAAAGFVWLDAQHEKAPLDFSKKFWTSRGKAALWAAVYSLQFEFGPLSEASIGNVGMHPVQTGWVDHVVTPVGAFVFMALEDWVDDRVILPLERRTGNVVLRAVVRIGLNPSRSMSAMAQGQMPWTRVDRGLRR